MSYLTGRRDVGRITTIYGEHAVGKSTLANNWKRGPVVFIDLDGGLDDIGPTRTTQLTSYDAAMNELRKLYEEDHDFRTVVVDGLDSLEQMADVAVAAEAQVETAADIDWGKGKKRVQKRTFAFLNACKFLRDAKDMDVVWITHAMTDKVENPELGNYDRFAPKMVYPESSEKMCEMSNEVLYVYHEVNLKSEDMGFGREKQRAMAKTRRLIRCQTKPSVIAKNRMNLQLLPGGSSPFRYSNLTGV